MKTIKPSKIDVLTRTFVRDGQSFLVVSPLLAFAFSPTRRLLSDQEMWKFVPAEPYWAFRKRKSIAQSAVP